MLFKFNLIFNNLVFKNRKQFRACARREREAIDFKRIIPQGIFCDESEFVIRCLCKSGKSGLFLACCILFWLWHAAIYRKFSAVQSLKIQLFHFELNILYFHFDRAERFCEGPLLPSYLSAYLLGDRLNIF